MKSPDSDNPTAAFSAAISGAGLPVPEVIEADGELHRFSTSGRAGDDSGWYVLHTDGVPAGAFGDWRAGLEQKWHARGERRMTAAERWKHKRRMKQMKKQREAEREQQHTEAAERAVSAWRSTQPATDHPYLSAKGVGAYGLHVDEDGLLIVPMVNDKLCSLQFIDADGEKRFLPGGRVTGCYHSIGTLGDTLYVCEGYATGASIHEATASPVAVAFNAGNLLPVAEALREKHPDLSMVLAADNDADGETNVGVAKATEAAGAIGGRLAVPPHAGDFNDLHQAEGLDAVREALEVYTPLRNTATAQHPPETPPSEPPKLAFSQDILADFRVAVQLRGLVGEIATAQLLYLAITSRLLDKPVSVGIKGHSSSGKSHTLDRVIEFFPEEAVVKFTAMSSRALVYRDDDYQHRTMIIYEVTGLREGNEDDLASYFVRTLLSEGRIDYDVTVRGDDGKYTTQKIVKEGPTNLIFTTTKTRVHAENETRVLSLNTDDGTEQTRNVLLALADESERTVDFESWRQLQAWLQAAERRVTIPFARQIAEAVPPLAVRLRRDFGAVLALIRSHAILHQATREHDDKGRIVATADDYAAVRDLVIEVISEGIGATVSDRVRETVRAVEALGSGEGATVTAIAAHLGLDKSNASRRVRQAADGGYIRNNESKRGRPGRWVVGDPLPETVEVLPQPATLRIAETRATPSGCAVAQLHEGVYTPADQAPPQGAVPIPPQNTPQQRNTSEGGAAYIPPKTTAQPRNTSGGKPKVRL